MLDGGLLLRQHFVLPERQRPRDDDVDRGADGAQTQRGLQGQAIVLGVGRAVADGLATTARVICSARLKSSRDESSARLIETISAKIRPLRTARSVTISPSSGRMRWPFRARTRAAASTASTLASSRGQSGPISVTSPMVRGPDFASSSKGLAKGPWAPPMVAATIRSTSPTSRSTRPPTWTRCWTRCCGFSRA